MTQTVRRYLAALVAVVALVGGGPGLSAQAGDPAALAGQLRSRYDMVALKDGIALVPQGRTDVRLIEVRDGGVAVNGEAVTAKELRTKVGKDADLILKITFLGVPEQRALAGPPLAGALPVPPVPPAPPVPGAPSAAGAGEDAPEPTRDKRREGDMVRIGGSVTVERDEVVKGDVVVIGGSADVDGEVTGDVNVVGGSLTLGPTALVRQNVAIVGGTLHRDPAARVLGKVDEVGVGGRFGGKRPNWRVERSERRSFGIGVFGTLLRGALMALIALIVVTLGRRHVEALSARVAAEPVRAGLVGLLAEIGFAPVLVVTIVVLAISIIGIPLLLLLPFALVLVVMLSLVGYTGVAAHVGEVVSRRLGLAPGVHATVAIGVAALVVVTLLGKLAGLAGGVFGGVVGGTLTFVGYLVEYLAWTLGLGGVILTWLQSRRKPTGFGQASSTAAASDAPPPEILGDDIPPFQRG